MVELDELTLKIARHLEIDWEYIERVDACDVERINRVRAAGWAAGQLTGHEVTIWQSDPDDRRDGRVVVVVALPAAPDAEEDRRMIERADLIMREAVARLLPESEPWAGR